MAEGEGAGGEGQEKGSTGSQGVRAGGVPPARSCEDVSEVVPVLEAC